MTSSIQLPDFLSQSADGEICLAGHRIGLYHVVRRYDDGDSAEMIASRYPTLPLALVHKVLAYYLDNQSEVDRYLLSCAAAIDQQRQGSGTLDLGALRQRLAKGHAASSEAKAR